MTWIALDVGKIGMDRAALSKEKFYHSRSYNNNAKITSSDSGIDDKTNKYYLSLNSRNHFKRSLILKH